MNAHNVKVSGDGRHRSNGAGISELPEAIVKKRKVPRCGTKNKSCYELLTVLNPCLTCTEHVMRAEQGSFAATPYPTQPPLRAVDALHMVLVPLPTPGTMFELAS